MTSLSTQALRQFLPPHAPHAGVAGPVVVVRLSQPSTSPSGSAGSSAFRTATKPSHLTDSTVRPRRVAAWLIATRGPRPLCRRRAVLDPAGLLRSRRGGLPCSGPLPSLLLPQLSEFRLGQGSKGADLDDHESLRITHGRACAHRCGDPNTKRTASLAMFEVPSNDGSSRTTQTERGRLLPRMASGGGVVPTGPLPASTAHRGYHAGTPCETRRCERHQTWKASP